MLKRENQLWQAVSDFEMYVFVGCVAGMLGSSHSTVLSICGLGGEEGLILGCKVNK